MARLQGVQCFRLTFIVLFLSQFFWLGAGLPAFAEMPAGAISNEDCLMCHGDPAEAGFVDADRFGGSIHSGLLCTSCHSGISDVPHDSPLPAVRCDACHKIENQIYLKSDHKQLVDREHEGSKTCTSCHGEAHGMLDSRDPASTVYRLNISATCGTCHAATDHQPMSVKESQPIKSYNASVHGIAMEKGMMAAAVCTDCHGAHDLNRATNPQSKLHWQSIPQTCGKCHENIYKTYSESVHGSGVQKGDREAPVCTDCHGEHTIDAVKLTTSKVYPSHIYETCGQCHAAERITSKYRLPTYVLDTYMESYHGLAMQLGSLTAANCASCHGFHNILPHTDPRSSIHPENLAKTCGKCHAGVGDLVSQGNIHSGRRPGIEPKIGGWIREFYVKLIFVVIGAMLLHNLLDFAKKLRIHYAHVKSGKTKERMGRNERIQHFILAFSFILLAYSGFALKYPNSWWAAPFAGHVDWRSVSHRVGAAMFGALSLYHVWYVLFTVRGRWHLKELTPRWNDLTVMRHSLLYYVGLRREKPKHGHYGYAEKMEYWALVWGGMVMGATGLLMLNQGRLLHHVPKWLLDVIATVHYYEAILACLAIVIWHGYFVMFDPQQYPMNWSWIHGRASDNSHPGEEK